MTDPAFMTLLPDLQNCAAATLWIADENVLDATGLVMPQQTLSIISNRFDVAEAARASGHAVQFSDLDFSQYPDGSFRRIVYRVSKEKAVVHHVLNQSVRLLAVGGELLIAGLKNEGTKTYIDKCRQRFGNGGNEKYGLAYVGRFVRQQTVAGMALDDQNYHCPRLVHTPELDFWSKPGLFGWNRIDQGSAFLLQGLAGCLARMPAPPQSLLDLGCGYGYLTLMTRHLPLARRVATDNNAAAMLVMRENAKHYDIVVDIVPDDAGASLTGQFDLILCNPPFHQGFAVEGELTEKFLRNTRRLLAPEGVALFVVNAFIGLEQKATGIFPTVRTLANNRSFKLVLLKG